jgi:hypothetical protein
VELGAALAVTGGRADCWANPEPAATNVTKSNVAEKVPEKPEKKVAKKIASRQRPDPRVAA